MAYYCGQIGVYTWRPCATRLKAKTLAGAKREATRRWVYENTMLILTDRTDIGGCIGFGDALFFKAQGWRRWAKGVANAKP